MLLNLTLRDDRLNFKFPWHDTNPIFGELNTYTVTSYHRDHFHSQLSRPSSQNSYILILNLILIWNDMLRLQHICFSTATHLQHTSHQQPPIRPSCRPIPATSMHQNSNIILLIQLFLSYCYRYIQSLFGRRRETIPTRTMRNFLSLIMKTLLGKRRTNL